MRAIKKARKFMETQPENPSAQVLSRLVLALESDQPFALSELYAMDFDSFELALDILGEWRLDRYYASKVKLLDTSMQLPQMASDRSSDSKGR